ncbi:MAG: SPFH domain-containing protein [Chloroflexi bacterium]|nr:SPFH domain-containing protein [Chloroflexota bacterium]
MARIFDVIEAPDMGPNDLVLRFPPHGAGDFRIGSQLIVRESQAAVFFRDGKALDVFGPGRHTITTANIPLLVNALGKLFDGRSPFTAEVYFVNLREFPDRKFGTEQPIPFRDPDLGIVRLRARGMYAMQIEDPRLFVENIVGQQGLYESRQIEEYLRRALVSRLLDILGETKVGLFDLPALYDELAAALRVRAEEDFKRRGIRLKEVRIVAITPDEETEKAISERAAMGAIGDMTKYLQWKAARAMEIAAGTEGAGGMTGAGVGLGAGMGMGAGMAQIIASALGAAGAAQQTPAPTPAPATPKPPKTPEEIRDFLDALDVQLATGQISEALYNRLVEKWQKRLEELEGK